MQVWMRYRPLVFTAAREPPNKNAQLQDVSAAAACVTAIMGQKPRARVPRSSLAP